MGKSYRGNAKYERWRKKDNKPHHHGKKLYPPLKEQNPHSDDKYKPVDEDYDSVEAAEFNNL